MKNGQFKIRHGVPIPPARGRQFLTDTLKKMRIGDCVDVYKPHKNIYPAARCAGIPVTVRSLIDKDGKKFCRVWRRK